MSGALSASMAKSTPFHLYKVFFLQKMTGADCAWGIIYNSCKKTGRETPTWSCPRRLNFAWQLSSMFWTTYKITVIIFIKTCYLQVVGLRVVLNFFFILLVFFFPIMNVYCLCEKKNIKLCYANFIYNWEWNWRGVEVWDNNEPATSSK